MALGTFDFYNLSVIFIQQENYNYYNKQNTSFKADVTRLYVSRKRGGKGLNNLNKTNNY